MNLSRSKHVIIFICTLALAAMACSVSIADLLAGGQTSGNGTLGDIVWLDSNGDGIMSGPEQGMPGVTVRLLDENAQVQAETQTDEDGNYQFEGVGSGTYQVEFIPPEELDFTLKDVGEDDTIDSDARMSDGRTDPFEFDGGSDDTRDAGMIPSQPAATQLPPTITPAPTNTPLGLIPNFFITYEHTAPGSYSEIIVIAENLEAGQEISGVVTGPAVDGDGSFTAVADESGMAVTRVTIYQFGNYSAEVPELGLSGSVEVTAADPE